jgi:hypothetical protein
MTVNELKTLLQPLDGDLEIIITGCYGSETPLEDDHSIGMHWLGNKDKDGHYVESPVLYLHTDLCSG